MRKETAREQAEQVRSFLGELRACLARNLSDLDRLERETALKTGLPGGGLADYWRCMAYDLGTEKQEGLKRFYQLCRQQGLLDEVPKLEFFS